jgi:hypothetical protein
MNHYQIATSPAVKHTITITRRQLWKNFVENWADMAADSPCAEFLNDLSEFQNVAKILCDNEFDYRIRQPFRRGHTFLLMGDAIKYIDTGDDNTIVEIIVTDGEKSETVYMNDINY